MSTLWHKNENQALSKFKSLSNDGGMEPLLFLINLVKQKAKQGITVAEIGVWDGKTTRQYIDTIKNYNGKLYAVDWFLGNKDSGSSHKLNIENEQLVYETFYSNLEGYHDYIEILHGNSHEQISKIPDHSLDICFIDADHSYKSTYTDIYLCLPKVKEGGIICGHDCEYDAFINFQSLPFSRKELEGDFSVSRGCHAGVIQAVFDHFGNDVEFNTNVGNHNSPPIYQAYQNSCWMKRC